MDVVLLTKSSTPIIGWFAEILGFIMNLIFDLGITNIGVAIIIFTLVINIIMIPLTINQQKSQKLQAVIQPEIKAIQDKYKGKTDNESAMKMNAETRAVYSKYGTSMAGGCLPLLIQMPILFGLYQVIYRIPAYVTSVRSVFETVATSLMQQSDYINKISDLAKAVRLPVENNDYTIPNKVIDLLYKFTPEKWTTLSETFPNMRSVLETSVPLIKQMNSFLGIDLSVSPWQGMNNINIAWIIPILAGVTQFISTKVMTTNQPKNGEPENEMAKQMQSMNTVMPIMSVVFCFTLPAGIGIYWIASALARTVIQLLVNYRLKDLDIDKLVESNLAKQNAKRAKQGLPALSANKKVIENAKHMDEIEKQEKEDRAKKYEVNAKNLKDSTEYYNKDAKPGSLASKANMVAKYNEKQANSKKNK
ncbi:YidC/Oxa1 family membrane protein insertase [Lachnoanaerobaculum gingivalis]|uniref:YidC/Oxa1 family membrane protein insertase n=1 Tax=Lachnoanaerobaculum gingivalis TaxID=2490855 RepID=UPI0024A70D87|nr:YidC/Oxa1 family membrane protein insertase [Lachnoanaerobaculum gingivalis]WHE87221.1 YidC/Oxa1 family membrane protein insertase [Lachnoanaerobaculum gingivalis]